MMKQATRPAIFKWRQTAPELILCAVRWYLRYSLSLRDIKELFTERGLTADRTTGGPFRARTGDPLIKSRSQAANPAKKHLFAGALRAHFSRLCRNRAPFKSLEINCARLLFI